MKVIYTLIFTLISLSVFSQDSNVFESVTVGFKAIKPSDWQFVTADVNLENLQKIEMSDKEFKRLMLKYSTAPLVAMMKHPEPFDELNPSFKVNIKPLGQLKGFEPKQILRLFLPQFQKVFKEFNLVQAPMNIEVSELPAAYMRINYSLATQNGDKFPTTSELWIVPRGDYFFMIGAGTRQDESTGSREEIAKILASLEL